MGLVFLSILIPYVFWLAHLVHLHSVLLQKLWVQSHCDVCMFYACSDVSGTLSHRIPLRISCRAGLVVTNSFSFCLFGKTFISPSFLNDRFPGQRILGCILFLCIILKIFCHSFLACWPAKFQQRDWSRVLQVSLYMLEHIYLQLLSEFSLYPCILPVSL